MSFPVCVMLPEDCGSSPAMALKSVVFPHPDGPRKQMNSLSLISRERSCTATNSPKCFVRFSMRRKFCFDSGMVRCRRAGPNKNSTQEKGNLEPDLLSFRLCVVSFLPLSKNPLAVHRCKFKVIVNHGIQNSGREMLDRLGNSGIGYNCVAFIVKHICFFRD